MEAKKSKVRKIGHTEQASKKQSGKLHGMGITIGPPSRVSSTPIKEIFSKTEFFGSSKYWKNLVGRVKKFLFKSPIEKTEKQEGRQETALTQDAPTKVNQPAAKISNAPVTAEEYKQIKAAYDRAKQACDEAKQQYYDSLEDPKTHRGIIFQREQDYNLALKELQVVEARLSDAMQSTTTEGVEKQGWQQGTMLAQEAVTEDEGFLNNFISELERDYLEKPIGSPNPAHEKLANTANTAVKVAKILPKKLPEGSEQLKARQEEIEQLKALLDNIYQKTQQAGQSPELISKYTEEYLEISEKLLGLQKSLEDLPETEKR